MIPTVRYHQALLGWYDVYQRRLPWRVLAGHKPDPYKVWVSEIMLQQTTVPTVKEFYIRFLEKWPTVDALAGATLDEVFHAWQGLGYYSRARNLYKCAQLVHTHYKDQFPSDEQELLKLPGIGPYTAAAIASIAFNKPATVVDGNIERIMTRLFRLENPLPLVKKEIQEHAQKLISTSRPSDYAQALMDLGSTVCTPKKPKCVICPLQPFCKSFGYTPEALPKRLPKVEKPTRYGTFFWVENEKGEVLLEKRPDKGLLAGLMGFPTSGWSDDGKSLTPSFLRSEELKGVIRHTFTHFHLIGKVIKATSPATEIQGVWVKVEELGRYALPTLMKKVKQLVHPEDLR
jgi:A/G-specific adenine glycosylase